MKGKALLFGLNYKHCSSDKLNGCINDCKYMADYIESEFNLPTTVYTDELDLVNTSYAGILSNLYKLAVDSYKENLDFVWIHYSGHGSYEHDVSGDEKDGQDEGLVPSDYETRGILIDDYIHEVFSHFNNKTIIFFVCDSCHSGTMADIKYSWNDNKTANIENANCKLKSNVISISGCLDAQTSADAYNLLGDYKYVGALTSAILRTFKEVPESKKDVFKLVNNVRKLLLQDGFKQYPKLCSTQNIASNPSIFPLEINTDSIVQTTNYYDVPSNENYNYYQEQPIYQEHTNQNEYYQYPTSYQDYQSTYYKPPIQYLYNYFFPSYNNDNTPQRVLYRHDLPKFTIPNEHQPLQYSTNYIQQPVQQRSLPPMIQSTPRYINQSISQYNIQQNSKCLVQLPNGNFALQQLC